MIGRLRGKIAAVESTGALVDVNGVGYELSLPLSTLAALPPEGSDVELWIYTHVREDELRLFGFNSTHDRTAFKTMLKVSGVGPKVALAVIGALSGNDLATAINEADTKRLSAIPGIGKKTAERIILELGGKLQLSGSGSAKLPMGVFTELGSALVNLGFKAPQVDSAIGQLKENHGADTPFEILLREGLAMLRGK